jgi:hypothetical protein
MTARPSISATIRIGCAHFGHSSGSASQTFDVFNFLWGDYC